MKSIITFLAILVVITIVACTYSKRDFASPSNIITVDSCKDSVHFSTTLQPIITSTCAAITGCHNNHLGLGALAFDYTNFSVIQANDSAIYTRITMPTTNTGVGGFMPKGFPPLTQAQIQAFYCWWKQGGQNN
jgi:hypothetical protein